MAANYDNVLAQLNAHGLRDRRGGGPLQHLEVTGRVVRCRVEGDRETRGWYVLHAIPARDGGELIVGSYGIWHGNDNGSVKIELERTQLSEEQRTALRERMREDARRASAARKASAERAAQRAEAIWRKCRADAPASVDYLARKGVQGHGVRYTDSGAVVIPIHDATGRIHGLQFLLSRHSHGARIAKLGRDKEYWPAGLSKQGHWFQIGSPSALVLLCEGYATGASLHEATGHAVAVAFDAGNLAPVAKALRRRYPSARILICADDDFASHGNPGIDAASAAALAVSGAWLAPSFTDVRQVELRRQISALEPGLSAEDWRAQAGAILRAAADGKGATKATDFNDLHALEGLVSVRSQIESKLEALQWTGEPARAAATPQPGGGGGADSFHFDMEVLLRDMTLVYGTDTVFDDARARIIGLGPLRSAAGKGLVRQWLEHPGRKTVLPEQVGFDPSEQDPDVRCNLWAGWPTTPAAGDCQLTLELLEVLCSNEQANSQQLYDWVLRWLAYPLQHPGAKMQTSLLVHGPEGTGKNTFFGAIRRIYGRYGTQFSQVELESAFNGWASGKLFAIGNEVVSRAELYHIQGRLKSMITEPEWIINEKMLPARAEQNCCNFAFFSNRVDIAKLDSGDRRYCVIWTPPALSQDFYSAVARELRDGGIAALHDHLLHLDLGDFNEHTKPPETKAKADLVELGMDSTERFWRDWTTEAIGELPCLPCKSDDLYDAYRHWCLKEGIGKAAQKQTLLTAVGKKAGVRKAQARYRINMATEKKTVIWPGVNDQMPDSAIAADWLGDQIYRFREALNAWKGEQ